MKNIKNYDSNNDNKENIEPSKRCKLNSFPNCGALVPYNPTNNWIDIFKGILSQRTYFSHINKHKNQHKITITLPTIIELEEFTHPNKQQYPITTPNNQGKYTQKQFTIKINNQRKYTDFEEADNQDDLKDYEEYTQKEILQIDDLTKSIKSFKLSRRKIDTEEIPIPEKRHRVSSDCLHIIIDEDITHLVNQFEQILVTEKYTTEIPFSIGYISGLESKTFTHLQKQKERRHTKFSSFRNN